MIMGHQIKDVFFQVGAGAADPVHLILAYHLGERQAKLRGGHCAAIVMNIFPPEASNLL